jgi:hypothetical protein
LIVLIPPGILAEQLPIGKLKHISEEFKKLENDNSHFLYERDSNWDPHDNWVNAWSAAEAPPDAWMQGKSYIEPASPVSRICSPFVAVSDTSNPKATVSSGDAAASEPGWLSD